MSRQGSSFVAGAIIGAVVGAAAALILAPQSGKETRAKIREWKDEHEDFFAETRESTERLISKTKGTIEELIQRLNHAVRHHNGQGQQPHDGVHEHV